MAKSNLQKGLPFLKGIFRTPSEKRKSKQNVDLPPPTLPLPWQAFPGKATSDVSSSDCGSATLSTSSSSLGPKQLQETLNAKSGERGVAFEQSGIAAPSFPTKLPTWKTGSEIAK